VAIEERVVEKPRPDDPRGGPAPQSLRAIRPAPSAPRPELREALVVVWRRKWSILAITLLMVGVALLASSRQIPIYESKARVLVTPVDITATDTLPPQDPNIETEAELVNSVAVAEIVANNLDVSGPPRQLLNNLTVDQRSDTEILEINYRDPDPSQAQRVAMGFAEAYLQFRKETVTEAILRSAEATDQQIAVLTENLQEINRRLDGLSETNPNRGLLESQVADVGAQILQLRLQQVGLSQKVTVGRIIQPAALSSSPVSPNHVVNAGFGLFAGVAIGVGVAFLRDRLSENVRSSEEAEAYLEAPVLGVIPRVPEWRRRKKSFLVTAVHWRSPAAEAYRVLRTNVMSSAASSGVKSIAVTSAHAGEGKSATVANLGVVLARAGKRVTLVSADLRRPRLHTYFEREGQRGLIEVLAGQVALADALQEVTLPTRGFDADPAFLRLLPSGRVPEDPTELITSDALARVLRALEDVSDFVLIDLPPVFPVTDALIVADITKNVLLVIGPKAITRPSLAATRQQLDRIGARILGGVLNGPDATVAQTYSSY
jgi:capsular exopolysaccharide synthesis family protein